MKPPSTFFRDNISFTPMFMVNQTSVEIMILSQKKVLGTSPRLRGFDLNGARLHVIRFGNRDF